MQGVLNRALWWTVPQEWLLWYHLWAWTVATGPLSSVLGQSFHSEVSCHHPWSQMPVKTASLPLSGEMLPPAPSLGNWQCKWACKCPEKACPLDAFLLISIPTLIDHAPLLSKGIPQRAPWSDNTSMYRLGRGTLSHLLQHAAPQRVHGLSPPLPAPQVRGVKGDGFSLDVDRQVATKAPLM